MSGSNYSFIAGTPAPAAQPLDILKTYGQAQQLVNAQESNKLTQAQVANTQQDTSGKEQDQAIKGLNNAYQQIAAATLLPPDQRGKAMYNLLETGHNTKGMTDDVYNQLKSDLPSLQSDPSAFTQYGMMHMNGILSAKDQLESRTNPYSTINLGRTTQVMAAPSAAQQSMNPDPSQPLAPTPVGALTNTITPGEAASRTNIGNDPITGNPRTAPMADVTPTSLGGNIPDNSSAGPQMKPMGGYSRNNPPPINMPGGPATSTPQQSQPSSAQSPNSTIITQGNAPTFEASVKAGQALNDRADLVANNKGDYNNMMMELQRLNTMGPGTERETAINGFIQKFGLPGVTMDRDQVAGAENFKKIGLQIAQKQAGALGNPSDATQTNAMGANPHLDMSKLGNEEVLHKLLGNEDAIDAKRNAWNTYREKNGAGSYNQFSQAWNKDFDVRAYQYKYMSDPERKVLRSSLGGPGSATETEFVRRAKLAATGGLSQ